MTPEHFSKLTSFWWLLANICFQLSDYDNFYSVLASPPRVAIIREEGSNGDREMAAAFLSAGFEPWDINMQDLMDQSVTLDGFRGVAFVGGFSYADVCGSAKGTHSHFD